MRLFLALNFPDSDRARIHEAAQPLRESGVPVQWLDPDRYHLTLKFLGDVRGERLSGLQKAVGRVSGATRAFTLRLQGFGAFPTIRRPQVIWLGADPTPALRCLKQDLEWGLASHGFERETRAFHPHVTLGRSRVEEGAGSFRGLDDLAASLDFVLDLPVSSVDVVRSHLKKQGNRYTILERLPLRNVPPRG
jgi:RNA 2',3'-cyclic 3'-phosphodiesterase